MNPTLLAILYVAGLALIAVEVVTPGIVLGLFGVALLGTAVYFTFDYGVLHGLIAIGATTGLVGASGLYAVRRLTLRRTLDAARGYSSADPALAALAGAEGTALTPLRPSGFASFDGRRVSVVTRGEPIDPRTKVRVVEVEGARVVVRAT